MIIIYSRHKKSIAEISRLIQQSFNYVQHDVDIKFYWSSGMKDYISFITNCDLYFHTDYFILVPYQSFPFKAYHRPITFHSRSNNEVRNPNLRKGLTLDKLELNKFNRKEIEIHYSKGPNKYRIKFKNLYKTTSENLEIMKNYI